MICEPRAGLGVVYLDRGGQQQIGHLVKRWNARLVNGDAASDDAPMRWQHDGPSFLKDSAGQYMVTGTGGTVFLREHEMESLGIFYAMPALGV